MKRFLLPVILLLSIFPLKTLAEEYKIRFSEHLSWSDNTVQYAVVERINNTTWYVRQTTLTRNGAFFNQWWDHYVTFYRICLLAKDGGDTLEEEVLEDEVRNLNSKDGWDDSTSCIEGDGGLFQLPENSNIQDYSIEIKWIENDEEQYFMFELTDKHLQ